jgi:hypothetical protein
MKLLSVILLAAVSAVAQPLDAFVGVWEVDIEASPLSNSDMPPFFQELRFETQGQRLVEHLVRSTSSANDRGITSMTYLLNGKATTGRAGDVSVTMTAEWKGENLAITWRAPDNSILYQLISLSPNRRIMTVQFSNRENPERPDHVLVLKKTR